MDSSENIKELLKSGESARENADYSLGERLLGKAFNDAVKNHSVDLANQAANALSVQYRLSAGRFVREGNYNQASRYSKKSMKVYTDLEKAGLLDRSNQSVTRNQAHALLYAGKLDQAVPALLQSAKIQTDLAVVGDEYIHAAAGLLELGQLDQGEKLIEKGLQLLQKNSGHPVMKTFALMTEATLQLKLGRLPKAREILKHALELAKDNSLKIREIEVTYMLDYLDEPKTVLQTVARLNSTNKNKL